MKTALAAFVVGLIVVIVPAGATAAGGDISVSCSPGPANCSGWFKVPVTVHFSITPFTGNSLSNITGCGDLTVSSDTNGVSQTCSATVSDGTSSTTLSATASVKKDGTPPVISSISAPPPDRNGWHNHPFGISVNASDATSGIASCPGASYGGPDTASGSFSATCTDNAGNSASGGSLSFKYDASPPSVSAGFSRGPDSNGWYRSPVSFGGSGSDGLSGLAGCSGGTYSGPDTGGTSVSVSCSDNAGNVGSRGLSLKYDAKPPTVGAASFERPPDANGWYNKPIKITFSGSDDVSGASCSSTTYAGPDNASATVTGSCVDGAGNTSGAATSPAFKYDSTPPKLSNVAVSANDKYVALTWSASPDTTSVTVTRTPGTTGADPSNVYTGLASRYDDHSVQNKVRYTYAIQAVDQAANTTVETVTVVPAAALYSPAQGAVVRSAPMLAWRAVRGATYYNVQLFRGRRKILSAWPVKPKYRLKRAWAFHGKKYKLTPGSYEWRVWPGLGKRAANKYGPLIGHSTFAFR
jgi:hypothetical protein